MPFPTTAPEQILKEMVDIAVAAALHTQFGMASLKFRHERHRGTMRTERPAVAFRLISVEHDPEMQAVYGPGNNEICWKMSVGIVVDLELPAENDVVQAGDDPTGWNQMLAIAGSTAVLMWHSASPLRNLVDDITPGDIDPEEDSTPDEGRLAQVVNVLYRTLWDDPHTILS